MNKRELHTALLIVPVCVLSCAQDAIVEGEAPEQEERVSVAPPRVKLSRETTFIIGPLRSDGTPDYVAALNARHGSGVTPQNNAAIPLLLILAEPPSDDLATALGISKEQLNASPRFLGGILQFQEYIHWREETIGPVSQPSLSRENLVHELEAELLSAIRRPWSPEEKAFLAMWLRDMKPSLEAVKQAVLRPRYWVPVVESLDEPSPFELMRLRNLANAFSARAMLRAHEDDWKGSLEEITTVFRLAERFSDGSDPIESMFAIALEGFGLETLSAIASVGTLDESALGALPARLEQLENASFASVVNRARFSMLDATFRGGDIQPEARERLDYNELLRTLNEFYDILVERLSAGSLDERREVELRIGTFRDGIRPSNPEEAQARLQGGSPAREEATKLVAWSLIDLMGSLDGLLIQRDVARARIRLGRVILALALFHAQHGGYPRDGAAAERLAGGPIEISTHGFRFRFHSGPTVPQSTNLTLSYTITATPEEAGVTGSAAFCVDSEGRWVINHEGAEPQHANGACLEDE